MRLLYGLLFGAALLFTHISTKTEAQEDKAAKCKAGFKRCMDRCEREATANTGKASSPARVKYCRETFCIPAMQKGGCPGY